mmetsp:Transcript_42215/g.100109  ORF Transcript_42215/g.100109 Transcript_42215/m.100109 type:complete len:227 (+) Transcript_42215:2379-3059(+)
MLLVVSHTELKKLGARGPDIMPLCPHLVVLQERHLGHEARKPRQALLAVVITRRKFPRHPHITAKQRRASTRVDRHSLDESPLALLDRVELGQPVEGVADNDVRLGAPQLLLGGEQGDLEPRHEAQGQLDGWQGALGGLVAGHHCRDLEGEGAVDLRHAVQGVDADAQRPEQPLDPVDGHRAALLRPPADSCLPAAQRDLVKDRDDDLIAALAERFGAVVGVVRKA